MPNVLSLDQSSKTTGWAVFDTNGNLLKYGHYTCRSKDVYKRLVDFRDFLINMITDEKISTVIYEDIQLQDNVQNNVVTYKTLAQVIGVLTELLSEKDIEFSSVFPVSWKKQIGIRSVKRKEQKAEAQNLVELTYHIKATEDEADAICIGTYYFKNQEQEEVQGFSWTD